MQLPDFKEGATVVFSSPPAKDIKKWLSFLKINFVVRRLPREFGKSEILVLGGIHGLEAVLSQLGDGAKVEHVIPKPDCSQQLWVCGDFAVREVMWAEDLFQELATAKHRLCVIEGAHPVALRSGAEELIRRARKTRSPDGLMASTQKIRFTPKELLSELVGISPATKFIFTCHMKGQGVSREDRAQYQQFPGVIKVMGRTDSVANQKYLVGLVRRLYAR
jgi:hypothetical protein